MRLYPLAGEPLSFGYLFASHPLFDAVFVLPRTLMPLGRGEIVPHIGEHMVLWHAVAIAVQIPEVGLGTRKPLLCC